MLCRLISVLTDLGTVAAAAPTWMASYGAPSKKPSLPSPTVDRCSDFYGLCQLCSFKDLQFKEAALTYKFNASRCEQLWVISLNISHWPLNQFIDVFNANHSSTGTCLQTAERNSYCNQPCTVFHPTMNGTCVQWENVYTELTILAKQAVRYPLPEPTSSADAPSVSLSLNSSKAWACCQTRPTGEYSAYCVGMWCLPLLSHLKKSVTHHVWCTDGRLVACDKKICRIESQHKSKLMKHLLFCNTLCLYISTLTVRCICLQRVTKMRTYGLRRVCIRIVCRVDPSVCSQHGVKHSVGADDPMIWRTNDEAMALSWTGK